MQAWKLQPLLVVASILSAEYAIAGNGYVGIYSDPQGQSPCASVPPGSGVQLYVIANLEGPTESGIAGAEFRIEVTNPTGWFLSFTPSGSGTTALGQALDTNPASANDGSGVNIAFPTCQTGSNGRVSLGTIAIYNMYGAPTQLMVKRHSSPSNGSFICPLFVRCDEPVYSKVCMTAGNDSSCTLGKVAVVATSDPSYFTTGLNGLASVDPADQGEPRPVLEDQLNKRPVLVAHSTPDEVDEGGITKASTGRSGVLADTTWTSTWDFESGPSGWTTANNLIENQENHWLLAREDESCQGTGCARKAVLQYSNQNGCWLSEEPGYGNRWDYSVKVLYRGPNPQLAFDYSVSCGNGDFLTIECDSADSSNDRVEYTNPDKRWPYLLRVEKFRYSGTALNQVKGVFLETFGDNSTIHAAYIRFSSDESISDEDGLFDSDDLINAALIVDNVVVSSTSTGGLNYTETFDGDVQANENVFLINSARSTPFFGAPWARLYTHVTDNDKCTENTTKAWLLSDPSQTANFPGDMAFAPGSAVLRLGMDEAIVSPWISLAELSGGRPVLSFREFPGNVFEKGRIARSWSVRGRYNSGTCVTRWSDEANGSRNGPWQELDTFQWVDRVYDMGPVVNPDWDEVQVRIRVADLKALLGEAIPDLTASPNPGPGPFIDRVRIGRVPAGPFIDIGPDNRYQAQDAFPTQPATGIPLSAGEHFEPSTDIFGTCAFSMATDINGGEGTRVITGDSIVARIGSYGGEITKVSFVYRIVKGLHVGKKVLQDAVQHEGGLSEYVLFAGQAFAGVRTFAMDFDDDYFRGSDVLEYFWYAEGRVNQGPTVRVSYPPGITQSVENLTVMNAESLTDGLLEVSFLPGIAWDDIYRGRVIFSDAIGRVAPTPEEIAASTPSRRILYVNKANFDRRARRRVDGCESFSFLCLSDQLKRTALMWTLDHLDGSAAYDVYDVQGFGNTNNDPGSRSTIFQAADAYYLIIHDTGEGSFAPLPDGSNKVSKRVDQMAWYRDYLDRGYLSPWRKTSLWVLGNNWASETSNGIIAHTTLVQNRMGIFTVEKESPMGASGGLLVNGRDSFSFPSGCLPPDNIPIVESYFENDFAVSSYCPHLHDYDGFSYMTSTQSEKITHRYVPLAQDPLNPPPERTGAILMNKSDHPQNRWSTIGMGFAWSAFFGTRPNISNDEVDLATSIIRGTRCCPTIGGINGDYCELAYGHPEEDATVGVGDASYRPTALEKGTPNPFNNATNITFNIGAESPVRLVIFDVTGRIVRTLVKGKLVPNRYSVVWDGHDNSGRPVAAGLYLYQLEAGAFRSTQKLIVIR